MRLRLLGVCATLLFSCVFGAMAGGSSAGGAQIAPTDNSSVSTYKVTDTSPGASARDSAGGSTSQPGSSTSDSASSGSASSSNGSGSSAGPRDNTVSEGSARSGNANDISTGIAHEKVIDTGDTAVETEKPAKAESSDKTFAPRLLDTVSDISAVGAQKEHASDSKADEKKSAASEDRNDSHK